MRISKRDYEARKKRVDAGVGSDDDLRLVKHYEREAVKESPIPPGAEEQEPAVADTPASTEVESSPGSSTPPSVEPQPTTERPTTGSRRSRARTTGNR